MLVSRSPCGARQRLKQMNSSFFFFYIDKYFHNLNAMPFFYCVFSVLNLLYFEAKGSKSNEFHPYSVGRPVPRCNLNINHCQLALVIHICAFKQLLPKIQPNVGQEGACSHVL